MRKKLLVLALMAITIATGAQLVNSNRAAYVRLNLLLRGYPFARLEPPGAHHELVPHVLISDIVFMKGACVGYVDTSGTFILISDPDMGRSIMGMTTIYLFVVEVTCGVLGLACLIFCIAGRGVKPNCECKRS